MTLNALVDSFWPQPTLTKCGNERVNERYCLNVGRDRSRRRSLGRRSFHNVRPAAKKLLSPNLLCIRGTTNVQMSFERDRSVCQQLTAVNSRPRCKQALLQLVTDEELSLATLKTTRSVSLTNWKPKQLSQQWCDVIVTRTSVCYQARCTILYRLQAAKFAVQQ